MIQTYRKHNLANHEAYVKVFPNVEKTIQSLLKKDIEIGIVSAKMRQGVELGLEVTGLAKYFETIITIDDVNNPKPHPEPVRLAMNELKAKPASTTWLVTIFMISNQVVMPALKQQGLLGVQKEKFIYNAIIQLIC